MARRRTRRSKETSSVNENIRPVVEKGMMGGRFKPLTDHDIEQIHQTVLDVLENIGMEDSITSQRTNGFLSALEKIKKQID